MYKLQCYDIVKECLPPEVKDMIAPHWYLLDLRQCDNCDHVRDNGAVNRWDNVNDASTNKLVAKWINGVGFKYHKKLKSFQKIVKNSTKGNPSLQLGQD